MTGSRQAGMIRLHRREWNNFNESGKLYNSKRITLFQMRSKSST